VIVEVSAAACHATMPVYVPDVIAESVTDAVLLTEKVPPVM
jgi:hypothetical protein